MPTFLNIFRNKQFSIIIFSVLLLILSSSQINVLAQVIDYPAALRIQPDFSSFFNPEFLEVDLIVNTGGEFVNAIDATLNFSTTSLELASSTTDQSFCSFVVFNVIDNTNGYYRLTCGTPIAASSTDQFIARLKFKKLQPGFTQLAVAPESAILAHDGLGTNILANREIHNIYLFK